MTPFLSTYRRTPAQRAMDRALLAPEAMARLHMRQALAQADAEMGRAFPTITSDNAPIAMAWRERRIKAILPTLFSTLPDLVSPPCPTCGYDRASAGKCAGCGAGR